MVSESINENRSLKSRESISQIPYCNFKTNE